MSHAIDRRPRLALDAEPAGPLGMGQRLRSIDLLRGLVIMLMALDHTRDFFHINALDFQPEDPARTYPLLFLTRLVTHLCAPSFVLLAGVSAFLRGSREHDLKSLSWFLFSRGAWLVLLELTVIGFGWDFTLSEAFLQVIWAIGAGMMALAALVWLGPRAVLIIGVLIIAGHDLLDPIRAASLGAAAPLWGLIHEAGFFRFAGHDTFVAYPALPWIGIMALGYGLGGVFLEPQARRRRVLLWLGLAMLAAFGVLRTLNGYGDPAPWSMQDTAIKTAMSFLRVSKYPPSLIYDLLTLGAAFCLLALFERLKGPIAEVVLTYGRVPLFFYLLHVYLLHTLALLAGLALGYPASAQVLSVIHPGDLKGFGFSLAVVYLIWIAVLAALYPLCRWFGAVRRRRRDWWLSYL